jgi:alpha-glucosidase
MFLENTSTEPAETLAFIRRFQGSAILCVFNLSAEPAVFQTDGNLGLRAIDLPGLGGRIDGDRIALDGHEAFFGQVA